MNTLNIPTLPSEFDAFQNSVVPIFVTKQATYGILLLAITNLLLMKTKWDGLAAICDNSATQSAGATANRNDYQPIYSAAIESIIDLYLLNNTNVLAAGALTFHINTPTGKKSSIAAASSTVFGKVTYKEPLAQYFAFKDTVTGKKKKPKGVAFIELRYTIDIVAPASVSDCSLTVFICRANKKVQFVRGDEGKKAFYFGRYININGKYGPWCAMFSAGIV